VHLEGSVYCPVESVNRDHVVESRGHTVCPRKGLAS
jgi:uncharacterized protein (DUF427 family)